MNGVRRKVHEKSTKLLVFSLDGVCRTWTAIVRISFSRNQTIILHAIQANPAPVEGPRSCPLHDIPIGYRRISCCSSFKALRQTVRLFF
jgi:hypothetical protein